MTLELRDDWETLFWNCRDTRVIRKNVSRNIPRKEVLHGSGTRQRRLKQQTFY